MKKKRKINFISDISQAVVATSLKEAKKACRSFCKLVKRNGDIYAIDTETTGLDWVKDSIVMVTLYTPGMSLVLPFAWPESSLVLDDLHLLDGLFSNSDVSVFFHNAKFDMHFLKNAGIIFSNEIHDTCVLGFDRDVRKSAKLKIRVKEEFGCDLPEFKDNFTLGGANKLTLLDYPLEDVGVYAANDPIATYKLGMKFTERAVANSKFKARLVLSSSDEETSFLYDRIDRPCIGVLFNMERRGIKINKKKLRKLQRIYTREKEELVNSIYKTAGREFNLNSWQQRKAIFKERGFELASTDVKHLTEISSEDSLAALLIQYSSVHKLLSTYVLPIFDQLDSEGKLHTSFNLHMADTGRLSSSNPNLQNIPKVKEMRELFIPSSPDMSIVCLDYSAIELRVLAVVSEDKVLQEEFRRGVDVHKLNAATMYNIAYDEVTKTQRTAAKSTISFGVAYGMGARALAGSLGCSLEWAEFLISFIFNKYKGVDIFMKRMKMAGKKYGYVKTFLGRRRDFDISEPNNYRKMSYIGRQCMNTPIQGGAGDLMKHGMIRCEYDSTLSKLGARLLLQVHDELVFECPTVNVRKVYRRVKKLLESGPLISKMPIPFVAEGSYGKNWHVAKGD